MSNFETTARELHEMSEVDQYMRNNYLEQGWDATIDERNTARLKEIVTEIGGWPAISQIGEAAANAAWLLVQHADREPDFQQECLRLMKALPENEVRKSDLAYLEDRVRVNTGKPQLYGTQFKGHGETFGPSPIEDEDHLDERRAAVGLGLFAEYRTKMEELDHAAEQHRSAG